MNVGVIGAGASGMMAAITVARSGHTVTILEKNSIPGKKLLSTGNGKCNFTNMNMHADYYNEEGRALFESVYSKFNIDATLDFFSSIGIVAYNKNGYIYPRSEQASSVSSCLNNELARNDITVQYDCKIDSIKHMTQFYVYTENDCYVFDKLIIATGSNAVPKTGSDGSGYGLAIKLGHTVKKPLPALCGLKCTGADFKALSGVRCQARVKLETLLGQSIEDVGELQHTDYGISGIPVFQISGEALRRLDEGQEVSIIVDYAPEYSYEELVDYLEKRAEELKDKDITMFLDGMFNNKLCNYFINEAYPARKGNVVGINSEYQIRKIVNAIKNQRFYVKGHRGFDNCQVCTGGILCSEVKESLESAIVDGLYFAGEILDINGMCGGYNLQWAWSSGYVAGMLL